MSRNTSRTRARIDQLSEELTYGAAMRLRADANEIRPIVDAVVAYLVDEYPAQDLYIPSAVTYPVERLRAEYASGKSVRCICREYRISRGTLYQLLDPEQDTPTPPTEGSDR